jgi:hypothetical protein
MTFKQIKLDPARLAIFERAEAAAARDVASARAEADEAGTALGRAKRHLNAREAEVSRTPCPLGRSDPQAWRRELLAEATAAERAAKRRAVVTAEAQTQAEEIHRTALQQLNACRAQLSAQTSTSAPAADLTEWWADSPDGSFTHNRSE